MKNVKPEENKNVKPQWNAKADRGRGNEAQENEFCNILVILLRTISDGGE